MFLTWGALYVTACLNTRHPTVRSARNSEAQIQPECSINAISNNRIMKSCRIANVICRRSSLPGLPGWTFAARQTPQPPQRYTTARRAITRQRCNRLRITCCTQGRDKPRNPLRQRGSTIIPASGWSFRKPLRAKRTKAERRIGEPIAANGISPLNTCDFPKTEHLKPKTIGEAETEPIGTTSNHPFWSVDRQEFVHAGSLEIGERLQTLSGDVKDVQQKLSRPGRAIARRSWSFGFSFALRLHSSSGK
jgi:hypothetical protein